MTNGDQHANSLRYQCRGQDSNLHGSRLPRDFKSLASTDFATPACMKHTPLGQVRWSTSDTDRASTPATSNVPARTRSPLSNP